MHALVAFGIICICRKKLLTLHHRPFADRPATAGSMVGLGEIYRHKRLQAHSSSVQKLRNFQIHSRTLATVDAHGVIFVILKRIAHGSSYAYGMRVRPMLLSCHE